jgi:hypothetical protein
MHNTKSFKALILSLDGVLVSRTGFSLCPCWSRAGDLHPIERKSPEVRIGTVQVFFTLRF